MTTIPADRESLWWATRPETSAAATPVLPDSVDVLVIGAGITGLSTAVELARGGRRPLVVEARRAGAGATGHTTAKVSLLQGDRLQRMRAHTGPEQVRAYLDANRAGQAWLADLLRRYDVEPETRLAVTYATTDAGAKRVRKEEEVAREAGLDIVADPALGLPFEVTAAIGLADQTQINPMQAVDALCAELATLGGGLVEGVRVTDISLRHPWKVETTAGAIRADAVVIATQTPIDDRGGHNLATQAKRSYAIAYAMPVCVDADALPMALSVDESARSLRSAVGPDGPLLLVGGGGHPVGTSDSTQQHVDELDAWAREQFGVGDALWSWSAQDYRLATAMPFVGALPGGDGTLLTATGFDKWGMAMGAAAGLILAGDLLGETPAYAEVMREDTTAVRDAAAMAQQAAKTAARIVSGRALSTGHGDGAPGEGEGWLEDGPIGPTAVSTVDAAPAGSAASAPIWAACWSGTTPNARGTVRCTAPASPPTAPFSRAPRRRTWPPSKPGPRGARPAS